MIDFNTLYINANKGLLLLLCVFCSAQLIAQCDYEHKGFIYFDQCADQQFFLIETSDGTILDPYIDVNLGFSIYNGQPVQFDYIMADVVSPCEGMPDAISITCIREDFELTDLCNDLQLEFVENCIYNFDINEYQHYIDVIAKHPVDSIQNGGFIISNNNAGQIITSVDDTTRIGPFENDANISIDISIPSLPFCKKNYTRPSDTCSGSQLEMATFRATALEDRTLIEWSTSTELLIEYFELERSFDSENYETFRTVNSKGSGNLIQEYQAVDLNTSADTTYYRLKAYDYEEDLYIINKTLTVIREKLSGINDLN